MLECCKRRRPFQLHRRQEGFALGPSRDQVPHLRKRYQIRLSPLSWSRHIILGTYMYSAWESCISKIIEDAEDPNEHTEPVQQRLMPALGMMQL